MVESGKYKGKRMQMGLINKKVCDIEESVPDPRLQVQYVNICNDGDFRDVCDVRDVLDDCDVHDGLDDHDARSVMAFMTTISLITFILRDCDVRRVCDFQCVSDVLDISVVHDGLDDFGAVVSMIAWIL